MSLNLADSSTSCFTKIIVKVFDPLIGRIYQVIHSFSSYRIDWSRIEQKTH